MTYPGKELAFLFYNAEPRRISDLPSADAEMAPTDEVIVKNGAKLARAPISAFAGVEIVPTFADISETDTRLRLVYVEADEGEADAPTVYLKNGTGEAIQLGIGTAPPPPETPPE
jgi:hypothetical protein